MSSYLNIYLVPKRKNKDIEKQYLLLQSYSRNSDVYEAFDKNINPVFAGDKRDYTILTKENIQSVVDDLRNLITSTKERLHLYEKYAKNNVNYIGKILGARKVLEDYEYTYGIVDFIQSLVWDVETYYSDFEEVCCNID